MCMFVEERECVRMPTIALLLNMKHHPLFPPHAQPGNDRRRKRRSLVRLKNSQISTRYGEDRSCARMLLDRLFLNSFTSNAKSSSHVKPRSRAPHSQRAKCDEIFDLADQVGVDLILSSQEKLFQEFDGIFDPKSTTIHRWSAGTRISPTTNIIKVLTKPREL